MIACLLAPAAPAAPDKAAGGARDRRPRTRPPESAPALLWNTFLGGPAPDGSRTTNIGRGIAVDGAGDIYMVGTSRAAWGSPVRPFTVGFDPPLGRVLGGEGVDAFVARLDAGGTLVWSTFLGGPGDDYGQAITVDRSGNVYVAGVSSAAWGRPVRSYTEGRAAFVARLDAKAGALVWNTFLGGVGARAEGNGIAVDGSGNVYVAGRSDAAWGRPVRGYTAGHDAFAAKLEAKTGTLVWNTFLGGSGSDEGHDVAVDSGGNLYVVGSSAETWGKPVRAHATRDDVFAARLDAASGALMWNTFLGGSGSDHGRGVAVDGSGNLYVAGESSAAWGSPVRGYTADVDAFVARLDPASGALAWSTFLGGTGLDEGHGMAVDGSGDVYLAGSSDAPWGSPGRQYSALTDAFAARLDASGAVAWTAFLGGAHQDFAKSIAVDGSGNVYVAGYSSGTWGNPVRAHPGGGEGAFAAKLGATGGARNGRH